ncbi:MAG TPA: allantoinase AllB [Candidatus Sulfotelmatobacter sp.]|nr:allantoinase AllB [Candidatus Sulfotelmatobacter sp.]
MGLRAMISRRIVTPHGVRPGAVLVEGERIRSVVAEAEIPDQAAREDVGNLVLLPGLVDSHVHINEPGRTDWEGFETATRAAAAGGCTTVVDMPLNCVPATTSVAALVAKRAAAQGKCRVDWRAWGGVVPDNADEIEPLARAGVPGFKCFLVPSGIDEFAMVREPDLRRSLPHLVRTGLPLLVHAELPEPIEVATECLRGADWTRYETYLCSRPDEAERAAIGMMLRLCGEYGFRVHIVHLATGSALDMLRKARGQGLDVTVESCPHYLHFAAEQIADNDTFSKCAPPIRSRENREQLWDGLREGVIDMVVTDHSPCPPEMKRAQEGNFQSAWGGIPSLSLALPVMWTEARQRGFELTDIARWMAEKPAQLARCGLRKGRIADGCDADLVVFDPDAEFAVSEDRLHHRHAVSPYLGEKLRGVVKRTYLRGELVYDDGRFPGTNRGREIERQARVS